MGDSRVRWLLGLALLLAAVRFVIFPWAQSQVEQRQQLEVLTQRLDRSASVVASSQDLLAAQEKVAEATEAARSSYPQVADAEQFRLEAQRTLSGIAGRGGVKVVLFDWVLDGDAPKAGLAYGRINASLEGPLDSVVSVHGQIEAEMPYAAVREVKIEFGRESTDGLGQTHTTMALVMDLYYRPAAAAPPASAVAGT